MCKVKGPKQGEVLIASFDGKSKSSFSSLKNTNALFLLSIKNNVYCQGEFLGSIVQRSVEMGFDSTFLIADEIYWHNLKSINNLQPEHLLRQKARELGDEFFLNNLKYFLSILKITEEEFKAQYGHESVSKQICFINKRAKALKLNFKIVRWNDWVNSSEHDFNLCKDKIYKIYETEQALSKSIELSAKHYVQRHTTDEEDVFARSKDYIKEESPAVIWVAAKLHYNFIVYPGDELNSFQTTKKFFIVSNSDNAIYDSTKIRSHTPELLVNWLHVNFKRALSERQRNTYSVSSTYPGFFQRESTSETSLYLEIMFTYNFAYGVSKSLILFDVLNWDAKVQLLVAVIKNSLLNHIKDFDPHHDIVMVNSFFKGLEKAVFEFDSLGDDHKFQLILDTAKELQHELNNSRYGHHASMSINVSNVVPRTPQISYRAYNYL